MKRRGPGRGFIKICKLIDAFHLRESGAIRCDTNSLVMSLALLANTSNDYNATALFH